jgi:RNase H-fold protein (predicted Holliday junction resolvase)
MVADKLMKALRAPSKVASALDWKRVSGSILSLSIGSDSISMAVASHPSFQEPVMPLESVPIKLETKDNRKILSKDVVSRMQEVIKNYNVAGFVVSWPVQKEGRCGGPCGKVLHTLDSLVDQSSTIMNGNRPFCLWDNNHTQANEDYWGRNPLYGEIPHGKTLHLASQEQYAYDSSSSVAVNAWNDFMAKQWPEIAEAQPIVATKPAPTRRTVEVEIEYNEEQAEAYMAA